MSQDARAETKETYHERCDVENGREISTGCSCRMVIGSGEVALYYIAEWSRESIRFFYCRIL